MNSDSDSSPPAGVGSSSHFPPNYLHLLQGLPLPERYLVNQLPDDEATYTEISIPTQTGTSVGGQGGAVQGRVLPHHPPHIHHQRQASKHDDDTDLDCSDFEDEEVVVGIEVGGEEKGKSRKTVAVSGLAGNLMGIDLHKIYLILVLSPDVFYILKY